MSEVVWKKLGDLCTRNKGTNITAAQMKEIESYNGDVLVFAAGSTKVRVQKCSLPSNSVITQESIIVKSRGYIDFEYCATPFTHKNELWSYSLKDSTSILKYIFYALKVNVLYFRTTAQANSVKLPQISVSITDNYLIPLPPLEVQQAIVNQLDTFTTLISRLESELELRQKQYEHYREVLLNFEGDEEVEWKTLGDIGNFIRGNGIKKSDFKEIGFDCIHYGQIFTTYGFSTSETVSKISQPLYIKCKKAKYGDLILATTSENIEDVGKPLVWLGEREVAVSTDAFIFQHNENPKFVGYLFLTHAFFNYKKMKATGTKVIRISSDELASFQFPKISPDRQQQIVSQLDTFEQLIAALKREIALRKKQYEYYREKLLTFDE